MSFLQTTGGKDEPNIVFYVETVISRYRLYLFIYMTKYRLLYNLKKIMIKYLLIYLIIYILEW